MSNPDNPERQPWEFTDEVPPGDNPDVTQHMAESAVNSLAGTLRDLVTMVDVHEDMAPTTSKLVLQLCSDVAGDILAWIRRWPR